MPLREPASVAEASPPSSVLAPEMSTEGRAEEEQVRASFSSSSSSSSDDPLYDRLRSEALDVVSSEPSMSCLLSRTVLHPTGSSTFEGAVAATIAHRLSLSCGPNPDVCPEKLRLLFLEALTDPSAPSEMDHTPGECIRSDALAHYDRDPACETLLEAVLFFKGYAAVVAHRVSRRQWYSGARFSALWIQSQASAAFGVDIHPAASVGAGVMFDHATGVVIGETARVGDGCTLLHGVTLGGTGKDSGVDRHPKVGRDVLIGANASVLGNIKVGDGAKIGAGSVVLRPVPHGATAVGSPAKVIGWAKERDPGSNIDQLLVDVVQAGRGGSLIKTAMPSSAGGGDVVVPASRTDSTASLTTVESGASLSREGSAGSGSGSEGGEEEEESTEGGASSDAEAPVIAAEKAATEKVEGEEEEGAAEKGKKGAGDGAAPPPRTMEEAALPTPIASGSKSSLVAPSAPSPSRDEEQHHRIRFDGVPPAPPPPPLPEILPVTRNRRSASYPLDTSQTDLAAGVADGAGGEQEATSTQQQQQQQQKQQVPSAKTLEDLPDNDCCSPFRDFRLRHAPPGCVTYCSLRCLLRSAAAAAPTTPESGGRPDDANEAASPASPAIGMAPTSTKVTDDQVGEVFWELLRRTGRPERRYVPRATFAESFVEVAAGFTGLDEGRCEELLRRWSSSSGSSSGSSSSSPGGGERSGRTAATTAPRGGEKKKCCPPSGGGGGVGASGDLGGKKQRSTGRGTASSSSSSPSPSAPPASTKIVRNAG